MGCVDPALNRFAVALSDVRSDLRAADVHTLVQNSVRRDIAARTKAMALVQLAACFERFMKDALQALLSELNSAHLTCGSVRQTLFVLAFDHHFESIRQTTGHRQWLKRVELLREIQASSTLQFNLNVLPLDGRTLRRRHLDLIWAVYGFQGASFPSPVHIVALESLADGRNEVAHGRELPTTAGRKRTVNDIKTLCTRIEEIAIHVALAVDDYLTNRRYL